MCAPRHDSLLSFPVQAWHITLGLCCNWVGLSMKILLYLVLMFHEKIIVQDLIQYEQNVFDWIFRFIINYPQGILLYKNYHFVAIFCSINTKCHLPYSSAIGSNGWLIFAYTWFGVSIKFTFQWAQFNFSSFIGVPLSSLHLFLDQFLFEIIMP